MYLYLSFFLFVLACLINIWLIFGFIKSKGHNPPFIVSFGNPKKEIIQQAELYLTQHPKAITVDLGCGSGSLLIPLAQKYPHYRFVGYEWDIIPYMLAIYKTRNMDNIKILYKNFFLENLSCYSLFLCYLGTSIENKLASKINNEASSDSLIISEVFKIPNLKLKQEIEVKFGFSKTKIYLYHPQPQDKEQ